jgi:hypothetical protein
MTAILLTAGLLFQLGQCQYNPPAQTDLAAEKAESTPPQLSPPPMLMPTPDPAPSMFPARLCTHRAICLNACLLTTKVS